MEANIKLYVVRSSVPEEDVAKKYGSIMISQLQLDGIVHALFVDGLVSFDNPDFKFLTPKRIKNIKNNTWELQVK